MQIFDFTASKIAFPWSSHLLWKINGASKKLQILQKDWKTLLRGGSAWLVWRISYSHRESVASVYLVKAFLIRKWHCILSLRIGFYDCLNICSYYAFFLLQMKQLRSFFMCKQGQITVNIGHISAKIEFRVEVDFIDIIL